MKLISIAAVGLHNELGKDNALLWHLPKDFKRFKALTSHHHIIMGRKTFESFPKPLPNRVHIIITSQKDYAYKDCIVVSSIKEAIDAVKHLDTAYVIGGGEIYKQFMPFVDELELTRVHGTFEADTYFPEIPENEWELYHEEKHEKDEKHQYTYTFETYRRKTQK